MSERVEDAQTTQFVYNTSRSTASPSSISGKLDNSVQVIRIILLGAFANGGFRGQKIRIFRRLQFLD